MDRVREDLFTKGIAFIEGCDEDSLVEVANQLGEINRPRNEKLNGSGVSHIRFAPNLVGKGYSSEGMSSVLFLSCTKLTTFHRTVLSHRSKWLADSPRHSDVHLKKPI